MNKMLFITLVSSSERNGYYDKVLSQAKAFSKMVKSVDLITLNNGSIDFHNIKMSDVSIEKIPLNNQNSVFKRKEVYKVVDHLVKNNNYDFLYIRFSYFDPFSVKCFKKWKKSCEKLLLEVPTFPYHREIQAELKQALTQRSLVKTIKNIIMIISDIISSRMLKKIIYKIVTFTNHAKIAGIKTIPISNGYSPDIRKKQSNPIQSNGELNILIVAHFAWWHAYDRVIRGLNSYVKMGQPNGRVKLIMVGNGEELKNLTNLAKLNKIESHIEVYGPKFGEELSRIFDRAHIAISHMGGHRRYSFVPLSPLKTREYCARGIPFIYSYTDPFLNGDEYFAKYIDQNDDEVNFNEIIDFSRKLNMAGDLTEGIRKYAEENFSWENQLSKVLSNITD